MRLNIVTCTMGVLRFAWETFVLLHNLRKRGLSENTHVLVWIPHSQVENSLPQLWQTLEEKFPEVKVEYFVDEDNFEKTYFSFGYIPLFRPYILKQYFDSNPQLAEEAIMYIDTDILFTKDPRWEDYLEDDICYLSDTNSYINATYFDSKSEIKEDMSPRWVRPEKWEEFKKRDILNECASFAGITRQICEKNNEVSGGAQYLLKNIDSGFWNDVLESTINIKVHLASVNQEFMQGTTPKEREDNGYQSWCADMWGVLWNLWRRGMKTAVPSEMDFTWATDEIVDKNTGINKLEKNFIFHNAGVTDECVIRRAKYIPGEDRYLDAPAFYKGASEFNTHTPFEFTNDLETIISNEVSKEYGTSYYAKAILETKQAFNL